MGTVTEENIRTEYAALTTYGNQVASYRFTLVGFYTATIGLMMSSGDHLSNEKLILLLWLSIALWLLELRNRVLLFNLTERGVQIERSYWGYRGSRAYEPFICHQQKPGHDYTKLFIWDWKLPRKFLSHSFALDLMYFGVIVFAVCRLFTRCDTWVVLILGFLIFLAFILLLSVGKFSSPRSTKEMPFLITDTAADYDEVFSRAVATAFDIGFENFKIRKSDGIFSATRGSGLGEHTELTFTLKDSLGKLSFNVSVKSNVESEKNEFVSAYSKHVKLDC